jgi:hypothetical protein
MERVSNREVLLWRKVGSRGTAEGEKVWPPTFRLHWARTERGWAHYAGGAVGGQGDEALVGGTEAGSAGAGGRHHRTFGINDL